MLVGEGVTSEMAVLRCWGCDVEVTGIGGCAKCSGTGKVFWVNGYAYPYTPEGERRAKSTMARH